MEVCLVLFAMDDDFPDVGAESVVAVDDLAAALVLLNAHERLIAVVGKNISSRDATTLRSAMAGRSAALLHVQEGDEWDWVVRRVKFAVLQLRHQL